MVNIVSLVETNVSIKIILNQQILKFMLTLVVSLFVIGGNEITALSLSFTQQNNSLPSTSSINLN